MAESSWEACPRGLLTNPVSCWLTPRASLRSCSYRYKPELLTGGLPSPQWAIGLGWNRPKVVLVWLLFTASTRLIGNSSKPALTHWMVEVQLTSHWPSPLPSCLSSSSQWFLGSSHLPRTLTLHLGNSYLGPAVVHLGKRMRNCTKEVFRGSEQPASLSCRHLICELFFQGSTYWLVWEEKKSTLKLYSYEQLKLPFMFLVLSLAGVGGGWGEGEGGWSAAGWGFRTSFAILSQVQQVVFGTSF